MLTLREARTRLKLTIGDLASRAGVGESTVYRIEHGKARPRPHAMRRLSAALGVDTRQIAEFRPLVTTNAPSPAASDRRTKVLVVDDEPPMRAILGELLLTEGYSVRFARDGQEALVELSRHSFDIMVADMLMPHLDGEQLVRELRAQGNDIPIIILSADQSRPLDPGVLFVHKPFDAAHLLDAIDARVAASPGV